MFCAAPQIADPRAKMRSDARVAARRPNTCDELIPKRPPPGAARTCARLPVMGNAHDAAMAYADPTHTKSTASRSAAMDGRPIPTAH